MKVHSFGSSMLTVLPSDFRFIVPVKFSYSFFIYLFNSTQRTVISFESFELLRRNDKS